jgi:hypothetical protein
VLLLGEEMNPAERVAGAEKISGSLDNGNGAWGLQSDRRMACILHEIIDHEPKSFVFGLARLVGLVAVFAPDGQTFLIASGGYHDAPSIYRL